MSQESAVQQNVKFVVDGYARFNAGERVPELWFFTPDAEYHAAVFKQDFPAHHVGNAVPLTRPHLRDVMRVDPPAPFELSITPEPQIPVRVGGAPRLDTVVGPAAFVADPDEVENLRDHSCGSPAATLCTGRRGLNPQGEPNAKAL